MGSEARDGRGPLSRVSRLEGDRPPGPTYQIPGEKPAPSWLGKEFSHSGTLGVSESPPYVSLVAVLMSDCDCYLGTSGTTQTDLAVNVDGVAVATGTIATGDSYVRINVGRTLDAGERLTIEITAAGTDAQDLTAHVRP